MDHIFSLVLQANKLICWFPDADELQNTGSPEATYTQILLTIEKDFDVAGRSGLYRCSYVYHKQIG